jgi:hypothetical protein
MKSDTVALVCEESLPKIRTVARDAVVRSSIASLAVWGAINAVVGFGSGEDNRHLFSGVVIKPPSDVLLVLYSGLIIGCVMLAFAVIAFLIRSPFVIVLDGLSIVGVGIWNLFHDHFTAQILSRYGYTFADSGTLWGAFGLMQIGWGAWRLRGFFRVRAWSCVGLSRQELQEWKRGLRCFVAMPENADPKLVKATATGTGSWGDLQFTGRLLDESAIFIATGLNDCFKVDREAMRAAKFRGANVVEVPVEGSPKTLQLSKLSASMFRDWGNRGQP